MEQYIKNHEKRGEYTSAFPTGGCPAHKSRFGWLDIEIGDSMIFSHRVTPYTRENFNEGMHSHDYRELIIYSGGDVEYIVGDSLLMPHSGGALFVRPGVMHTARLRSPSVYDRYVLYFFPEFFEFCGRVVTFPEPAVFLPSDNRYCRILADAERSIVQGGDCGGLLAQAQIITLFGLLAAAESRSDEAGTLTGELAEIKRYIDENYASVGSVSEVASRFFYSREHLSRRFREHFNVTPSEYLVKRRISESLGLLEDMSVADVCYAVGFGNQTSFISAFRRVMGCLPSEYKKSHRSDQKQHEAGNDRQTEGSKS